MPKPTTKDERVTFRTTEEQYMAIEAHAAFEGRSLGTMIVRLLDEALAARRAAAKKGKK